MKAPQEIIDLVARFDQNIDAYQSGKYNETHLRREFVDPFFKALGWDVENTSGYAEAYKDVIHEDAIKIGSANKAPDHSFRTGGTRKFFVEANEKPAPKKLQQIREEIGDVPIYLTHFADKLAIDPLDAAYKKMEINRQKYPVEKARGSAKKYTDL